MTGKKDLLYNLRETKSMQIYLPDGSKTMAIMVGRVNLNVGMRVSDVIYVPELTCNLISIRQLISALNCQITFTNELCVIQNCTLRMQIGAGKLQWGVYCYVRRHIGFEDATRRPT